MLAATRAHFLRRQRLIAAAVAVMRRAFNAGDPRQGVPMLQVIQRKAASDGALSVHQMLQEQGIKSNPVARFNPEPFGDGRAADGRSLLRLVTLTDDLDKLERIAINEVADAARVGAGVSIASRRSIGWVRMVNPPCCGRCAILAGRYYAWSDGFQRHPNCDCTHIPTRENIAGDVRTDPAKLFSQGQVTGLTKAEQAAFEDGADMVQVMNARRSFYVNEAGIRLTHDNARKAGNNRGERLTPESIYKAAEGDQDEAIRLLKRYGYLH